MKKLCKECEKTKDIAKFYRDRSKSDGRSSICKSCELIRASRYNTKHWVERVMYGITGRDY